MQEVLTVLVKKVPQFRHGGKEGSFRAWLRSILVYQIRYFYRQRQGRPHTAGPHDSASPRLLELKTPASELSRRWDAEHRSAPVVGRLPRNHQTRVHTGHLAGVRSCSGRSRIGRPARWAPSWGWSRQRGASPGSRGLRRLREEAKGLVND